MSAAQPAKRALVWTLPVAAGGCGACAQSVLALQASRYAAELRAKGVSFAGSPRHADVVLITGPVTTASLDGLRDYIESVPQPRALIAVGDCAIDSGVFRGSPDLVPSLAEALDVHVEIAGCPPAPSAVLAAIVEAAELLAGADEGGGDDDDTSDDTSDDTDEGGADEGGADAAAAEDGKEAEA